MALFGIAEDIGIFWDSFKWQSECLDPNRPGWLPKWIPTLEEKACQFGLYQSSNVPPNPPVIHLAAPQTEEQMTNPDMWDPLTSARQTRVDYIDAVNQTIDGYNDATRKKNEYSGVKALLLVGVAAFAVGTVLTNVSSPPGRRRR